MDVPSGLGERGLSLWSELSVEGDSARNALVLEAARLADRLDELDNIIQGKGVLDLMQFRLDFPESEDDPFVVEVKFQNVLSEARQQQLALANVLAKIQPTAAKKSGNQKTNEQNLPSSVTAIDRARKAAGK